MKSLAVGSRVTMKSADTVWEYGPSEASEASPAYEHANLGRRVKLTVGQGGTVVGVERHGTVTGAYFVRLDERGRAGREVRLFPRQVAAL